MSKSIMQTQKICYLCNEMGYENTRNLEEHHCIYGCNRKNSEHYGLKVFLCHEHHEGDMGVHYGGTEARDHLKVLAQEAFMAKHGSREDFIKIFGKAYV